MRSYELMIIHRPEMADTDVAGQIGEVEKAITESGSVTGRDLWGKRRFAYEIAKKQDGYYVVIEFLGGEALADLERQFRLADDIVRHKLIRLPDDEAGRRGLTADQAPATAG